MAKSCWRVWKWRQGKWLVTIGYLSRDIVNDHQKVSVLVSFQNDRQEMSSGFRHWTLNIYKYLGLYSKKNPFRLKMLTNLNIFYLNSNECDNVAIHVHVCYRFFFKSELEMKPIIYLFSWNSTKNQNKFWYRVSWTEWFLNLI